MAGLLGQSIVNVWIHLVELFETVDSDKFVNVERVLLLPAGEHLLNSAQGEVILCLGDRVRTLIVIVDSAGEVFLFLK